MLSDVSGADFLVDLDRVDVFYYGSWLLREVSWRMKSGEHWMISGGNGAGKSTMLRLIRGELWPHHTGGKRLYNLDGEVTGSAIGIRERIGFVSAEWQRKWRDFEWRMSGADVIRGGFFDTIWRQEKTTLEQESKVANLIKRFGIEKLAEQDIVTMSTGEARKVLIARALVNEPRFLLLDEFWDGLDLKSRQEILAQMEEVAKSGVAIVYTTHREDEVVPFLTHQCRLEGGEIVSSGPVDRRASHVSTEIEWRKSQPDLSIGGPILSVENCDVYMDRVKILSDLNWKMKRGENWALLGANGSGKSTFLRLLSGEEYPALGGKVQRFDFSNDTPVIGIRKKIGIVSHGLQLAHRGNISGMEVVLSGFHSSIGVYTAPTTDEEKRAAAILKKLDLEYLADKQSGSMSHGELRRLLIARALVFEPELLLLDEPLNGLDRESHRDIYDLISELTCEKLNVVFATHHPEDLPPTINRALVMKDGKIHYQGDFSGEPGAALSLMSGD